jgi:3-hydroxyisobutyrate dehydrogenase
MAAKTVGLVGVGMMGWPMANCMVQKGVDLLLYDVDAARGAKCESEIGAKATASLKELGARADVIITMLPNSEIVSNVFFGEGDPLAEALRPGTTVMEMSSGSPDVTIDIAARLAAKGVKMIDAPVSGGVPRAVAGTLTIMAGGDAAVVADCTPILETMGAVTHVGILGAGQAMKALNNLVSAGGLLIGVEALLIGQKFGLDPDRMVDILNTSSGMNNSTQKKFKQYVLSRKFDDGGFALGLMAKDVGIALDVAKSTGTAAPFSALCNHLWNAASAMLGPKQDHTAITLMCETFAKAKLGDAQSK